MAVMDRAPLVAVGTVALLVILGLPFTQARFATVDHRQLPAGTPARTASRTSRTGSKAGPPGGIDVVAHATDPDTGADYAARPSTLAAVVRVDGPTGTYPRGLPFGRAGVRGRGHLPQRARTWYGRYAACRRRTPLLGNGVGMLNGEEHRWHRRLMQPALSRAQITTYAETMSEIATRWCDTLSPCWSWTPPRG
jgi:hypothetical protein